MVQRGRTKERVNKHNRKKLRQQKLEGTYFDHHETAPVGDDQVESVEETPAVAKDVIAKEFVAGMEAEGVPVFLSGGGALAWQGGSRPIADLDFRVLTEDAGFTTFEDSRGQAVLRYINQVILSNSRRTHPGLKAQAQQFHAVGADALTIGTADWFGVEVSLSVVPWAPSELNQLKGDGYTPEIPVLTLGDLRDDKLKTLITRTKKGQTSIKKVSQDLFDLLDAIRLLDDEKDLKASLEKAVSRRMEQYALVNLEGTKLVHLGKEKIEELMMARLALTAQAHVKGGKRKQAFAKLLELDLTKKIGRMLTEVAAFHVSPELKKKLRPWFFQWNQGPTYGPPKKGNPSRHGLGVPEPMARQEDVDQLLSLDSAGYLTQKISQGLVEEVGENSIQVLRILWLSGGLRLLDDSKKNVQTLQAFGLTRSQFDRAYNELKKQRLVLGQKAGLALTPKGRSAVGLDPVED